MLNIILYKNALFTIKNAPVLRLIIPVIVWSMTLYFVLFFIPHHLFRFIQQQATGGKSVFFY